MSQKTSNSYVIGFVTLICFTCALILSVLATVLRPSQEREEEVYQSKQLLIAAKMLPEGATNREILALQRKQIIPHLVDKEGKTYTFESLNLNYETYLKDHQKNGYAQLEYKLIYFIENLEGKTIGYVIPINGYGLWDAIYGYLAIKSDGKTIIGTTWYDQKETPGLGANIATPEWQAQFHNKLIFQPNSSGQVNPKTSKLGLLVVKTSVKDELGDLPIAKNAVDGIAGATVTRNGVQEAYKQSLAPYRPFLVRIANE